MKIVLVDNYDRPWVTPVVIAENVVNVWIAEKIAHLLNEAEEENSPHYYLVKNDEWKVEDTF